MSQAPIPQSEVDQDAAEIEFEGTVAQAWMALFGVERASADDDFFLAGGDSLTAMRLASAVQLSTHREISVEDVFIGQTVRGIAARVSLAVAEASLPTGSAPVLSSAQRRLWFVEQFVPGVPVHNVVMAEHVVGMLEMTALQRAFEEVVERQAALRWRLVPGDGIPTVTVTDPGPVTLLVDDMSGLTGRSKESDLEELLNDEVHTVIELTGGALWRARVVRLDDQEHILVMTVHHIVFDGWSQAILYRELGQAYRRALSGGHEEGPAPHRVTFADYASSTLIRAQSDGPANTTWWVNHLAGAPTALDLPRDRPRPAVVSFSGARRATFVDADLTADVARLARSEGATVGAVLLAAFSVLMRRLTGQHDQVVGVPMADRGHADFEHLVGFFIQVLPLRLNVDDRAAFVEHVHRCRDELAAARAHADAPLERIVEALGGQRDLTRNPLFQVMFNVYNFAEARLDLVGAAVHPWQANVPGSLVDLTLYVIFQDDGIRLEAAYNCDLFSSARVDALLDGYAHMLRILVSNRDRPVAIASARPRGTPLPDDTSSLTSDIADGPGLLEQVRSAGSKAPDSVAVEEAGRILSYRELMRIVDGTAATLRATGVGKADVVAVLAERTAVLPGVLLGVLSIGARWAVVDCELPAAAVERRLGAINPRMLVRCCGGDAVSPALGRAVPVIDAGDIVGTAARLHTADAPASDRGYLSFTSGTTGEPKAIDTGELPLVHFLNWYRITFGLDSDARFAVLSGLVHDPLLRDMFTPLCCGGRLLVPAAELLKDPARLLRWLADRRATVAHLTPQLVRMMVAAADGGLRLDSLRLVAVGGDQLTEADAVALRLIAPRARLLNFYGTTETPQAQAYFEIPAGGRPADRDELSALRSMPVPVGAGIDGAQLLVMSVCGRPAAVGELGEVIIRSRYLSNGYVDRSVNGDRFADLPGGKGRVYRTGDLGRYGPSGEVTLAGRSDDQVKVRGYRIELGEVESVLCSHPDVESVAVQLLEQAPASTLHAYAVTKAGTVSASALIQYARAQLPSYAVPSGVTLLSALPLTAAGKVDRTALPSPGRARYANPDEPPCGDLERLILAVWSEVLGVSAITRNDSFFEVGGNSMAVIEVHARLKQALNRPVRVVDLFRFPTIRSLAGYLAGRHIDTELLASDLRGQTRRHRSGRRAQRQAQEN